MKLAIMQPYFFPYIGYFQLIAAVDVFVVYDDVQFIKNGWINRNRILLNKSASWITLPVERGHLQDNINQRHFVSY
jgi:WbqC-like protein family